MGTYYIVRPVEKVSKDPICEVVARLKPEITSPMVAALETERARVVGNRDVADIDKKRLESYIVALDEQKVVVDRQRKELDNKIDDTVKDLEVVDALIKGFTKEIADIDRNLALFQKDKELASHEYRGEE